MKIRTKKEIDANIAAELGLDEKDVKLITRAFLEHVRSALSNLETVYLSEFGRFRVVVDKSSPTPVMLTHAINGGKKLKKQRVVIHRKVRVHFSKARAFGDLMRAKYGNSTEKKP